MILGSIDFIFIICDVITIKSLEKAHFLIIHVEHLCIGCIIIDNSCIMGRIQVNSLDWILRTSLLNSSLCRRNQAIRFEVAATSAV